MNKPAFIRIKYIDFNEIQLDAPVDIIKGALIIDNRQEKLLLQLKLLNISTSMISSVYISVDSYDDANDKINNDEVVEHVYLDLYANPKDEFGEKKPVVVNELTRYVKVTITKVVYNNGEVWRNANSQIFYQPNMIELNTLDENLLIHLKQKILDKGYDYERVRYFPKVINHLWLCACGRPNRITDNKCIRCGMDRDFILSYSDEECIKKDYEDYLRKLSIDEEEKEKRRIIEYEEMNRQRVTKRKIRMMAIKKSISILVLLSFILIGVIFLSGKVKKFYDYKEVLVLMDEKKYLEVLKKIDDLGDYNDSRSIYNQAKYNYALELYDSDEFDSALEYLDSDFGDSNSWISTIESAIQYNDVKAKIENKDFEEAIKLLDNLKGFKDSDDLLLEVKYEYAKELYSNGYYFEAKPLFLEVKNEYGTDEFLNSVFYRIEGKWKNITLNRTESFKNNELRSLSHDFGDQSQVLYWNWENVTLKANNGTVFVNLFQVISINEQFDRMELRVTSTGEIYEYEKMQD